MDTQRSKNLYRRYLSMFDSLPMLTQTMKAQKDALVSMTADLMDQVNPYDFKDDVDQLDYEIVSGESDGVVQHPVRHLFTLFVDEMLAMFPMNCEGGIPYGSEVYKNDERVATAMGNITAVIEDCRPEVFTLIKHAVPAAMIETVPQLKLTVAQRKAFLEERIAFVDYSITVRKMTPAEAVFKALASGWANDDVEGTIAQMVDEAEYNAPPFNAPRYEVSLEVANLRADVARLNATVATLNEVIQTLTAR